MTTIDNLFFSSDFIQLHEIIKGHNVTLTEIKARHQQRIRSKMDTPESFATTEKKGEGPIKMGTDAKTKSQVTNIVYDHNWTHHRGLSAPKKKIDHRK